MAASTNIKADRACGRDAADSAMPNGRNRLGGRKPARPASDSRAGDAVAARGQRPGATAGKGLGKTPPAGAIKNADLTAGYREPKPSEDTQSRPKIDDRFGTHMGSTVHLPGDPLPKRRTIKTDAK